MNPPPAPAPVVAPTSEEIRAFASMRMLTNTDPNQSRWEMVLLGWLLEQVLMGAESDLMRCASRIELHEPREGGAICHIEGTGLPPPSLEILTWGGRRMSIQDGIHAYFYWLRTPDKNIGEPIGGVVIPVGALADILAEKYARIGDRYGTKGRTIFKCT